MIEIDTSILDSQAATFKQITHELLHAKFDTGNGPELILTIDAMEQDMQREVKKLFGGWVVYLSGVSMLGMESKSSDRGVWLGYESSGCYGMEATIRSFTPDGSKELLPWLVLDTVEKETANQSQGLASIMNSVAVPLTTPYIAYHVDKHIEQSV